MKNLLVTGGCGFIGSNFINYIATKNKYNIINYDALYYAADKNNINQSVRESPNYILVEGNLCSEDLVKFVLETYKIDMVIHFAAQSHVQLSFDDSLQFTKDNILGTHILLECVRKYGKIERFIHVSTDEVYGESMNQVDENCKTEQSILCPTNPYAATKAGAELQYPEKLVPRFIQQLKSGKKVTIQGEGSAVRAFLHAFDTATAFEAILEKGAIGEIYNIGCDEGMEYSVMQVAKLLIEMIQGTTDYEQWIEYIEDRPFNDQRYYISNEKLKLLGWSIKYSFEEGLKLLI
jgi:dTDP-D-glucose 4,6-dehydratase